MSLFVTLNKQELELVKKLAKARANYNRRVKRNDHLKADKSKTDFIEINGLGGEFAVARALNLFPDINSTDISRYDLVLPSGKHIEVKTTEHKAGHLLVRELNAADLYLLVTGTYDTRYEIVGYISANNLKDHKTTWYESEVYLVSQKDLIPIEKLLSIKYRRILEKRGYHESQ